MIDRLKRLLRRTGWFLRFYRSFAMKIKRQIYGLQAVSGTFFTPGWTSLPSDLVAGDFSYIGKGCRLCPKIRIGKYTMLSPGVTITGSDHNFHKSGVPAIFSGRPPLMETIIGSDVWIGNGALVMAGVKIGDGSIVAARSVVTKDVPAFSIYGGVPAKKIKDRFSSPEEVLIHRSMLESATYHGEFCKPLGDS